MESRPCQPSVGKPRANAVTVGPDLVLLLVALIWGTNIPVMKSALGEAPPAAFNFLRLTLSVLLLGWLDARERARMDEAARRAPVPWRSVIVLGLVGGLFYQALFLFGMDRTTAGNTGLFVATVPIWTALIAGLCRVERIRAGAWLGLAAAVAGAAVIAVEGGNLELARSTLTGNLLVLAAMLMWASFTVFSKSVLNVMTPTRLAFLSSLVALPGHALLALPHLGRVITAPFGLWTWFAVAYAGLLSSGLAYSFWNYGVRRLGPSHTAIYNNVVPIVALVVSWAALAEAPTLGQGIGGALILGGLVVMRRLRG